MILQLLFASRTALGFDWKAPGQWLGGVLDQFEEQVAEETASTVDQQRRLYDGESYGYGRSVDNDLLALERQISELERQAEAREERGLRRARPAGNAKPAPAAPMPAPAAPAKKLPAKKPASKPAPAAPLAGLYGFPAPAAPKTAAPAKKSRSDFEELLRQVEELEALARAVEAESWPEARAVDDFWPEERAVDDFWPEARSTCTDADGEEVHEASQGRFESCKEIADAGACGMDIIVEWMHDNQRECPESCDWDCPEGRSLTERQVEELTARAVDDFWPEERAVDDFWPEARAVDDFWPEARAVDDFWPEARSTACTDATDEDVSTATNGVVTSCAQVKDLGYCDQDTQHGCDFSCDHCQPEARSTGNDLEELLRQVEELEALARAADDQWPEARRPAQYGGLGLGRRLA